MKKIRSILTIEKCTHGQNICRGAITQLGEYEIYAR